MSCQQGKTAQQMLNAPHGAVYVWVNDSLSYPKALARRLGRDDLDIKTLTWLDDDNHFMGREYSGVVLDHAAVPTGKQMDNFYKVNRLCVRKGLVSGND